MRVHRPDFQDVLSTLKVWAEQLDLLKVNTNNLPNYLEPSVRYVTFALKMNFLCMRACT